MTDETERLRARKIAAALFQAGWRHGGPLNPDKDGDIEAHRRLEAALAERGYRLSLCEVAS